MFHITNYASPIGEILLASDEHSIVGLWIENQKHFAATVLEDAMEKSDSAILRAGTEWLDEYFAGEKPEISRLPLAPSGSEFRQTVWALLIEIPYGETTTYGTIAARTAERLGRPSMSARAVGGAIGHNPISIIIPCHRVVGANGKLTGYAGGIDIKIKLLEHEKRKSHPSNKAYNKR
ncbi:MAG: methylated-DNA--[protein]-cysteine S-methyltransferase [Fastidiosipilaceae bacterium]